MSVLIGRIWFRFCGVPGALLTTWMADDSEKNGTPAWAIVGASGIICDDAGRPMIASGCGPWPVEAGRGLRATTPFSTARWVDTDGIVMSDPEPGDPNWAAVSPAGTEVHD